MQTRKSSIRLTPPVFSGTVWTGTTVVPTKYIGIHAHRWPEGSPLSTAPNYGCGIARSLDYGPPVGGYQWRHIEPTDGAYSWSAMDAWCDAHYAAGRDLIWAMYGCPTWAAQAKWQATTDLYGYAGGGSPAASQASVTDFVSTLVTRYVNRGTPIKYLEIWNEPSFAENGTFFWWGSAVELATQARTVNLAAKAVDANITILSPSFTGTTTSNLVSFLNASDSNAGFGRQHVNGVGWHPYGLWVQPLPCGTNTTDFLTPEGLTTALRAALVSGGLASSFPLYNTEWNTAVDAITRFAPGDIGKLAARGSLRLAALGWKSSCWYSHDNTNFPNPMNDSSIANALGNVHALISGQTLTKIDTYTDGTHRAYSNTTILGDF
jgi:hypothetical protein